MKIMILSKDYKTNVSFWIWNVLYRLGVAYLNIPVYWVPYIDEVELIKFPSLSLSQIFYKSPKACGPILLPDKTLVSPPSECHVLCVCVSIPKTPYKKTSTLSVHEGPCDRALVWERHGNPITTLSLPFNQNCAIWIDFGWPPGACPMIPSHSIMVLQCHWLINP